MIDKKQFIGKYCDIQTKDGVWRLGVVESKGDKSKDKEMDKDNKQGKEKNHANHVYNIKEKDTIEVFLDGWSSNKKHKICLHSIRLQPPRYHSKGYTGQKSHPLRNFNFDFHQQIGYIVNWLKLFHSFDFQNLPILDITNLFRCQMFILVDSIIFHPWNTKDQESLREDLKKVENLFHNIVQISVLYIEKLPRFISEIVSSNLPYEKHSYLQYLPVSYLEASYELFLTLKSIFNFHKRSEKFFSEYGKFFKISFITEFIDLGFINLTHRFLRDSNNLNKSSSNVCKIFQEKFYILASLLDLNMKIFNRTSHQKLNKANQVKYVNEIISFLIRENFIELINKSNEDPDVQSLIESFEEFAKNNRNFVEESHRFSSFLKSISVFKDENGNFKGNRVSDYGVNAFTPNFSYKSFGGLNLPNIPLIQNSNSSEFLNKLLEIENKLSKLDDKVTNSIGNSAQSQPVNKDFQKTSTSEFNIISPIKVNVKDNHEDINVNTNMNFFESSTKKQFKDDGNFNNLINSKNSFNTVNDPHDEYGVLSIIEFYLNKDQDNLDSIKKIIKWRKRILDISMNNGWVVGKILASNTVRNFQITDDDIIEANLTFLDQFNILDRKSNGNFHIEIDYKQLLRNYEQALVASLNSP